MNAVDELNALLGIGPPKPRLPITLQRSGYEAIKILGKGSFGQAYLIYQKNTKRYYVAKHINLAKMDIRQRKEAKNEISILQQMKHVNVIRYKESVEQGNDLYIVMEYADGGDLYSHINKLKASGATMTEDQVINLFTQVAMAIKYMHDRKVIHRDIKPQNVFLTKGRVVKLGDFGISTVLNHTMAMATTMCGTPCYFSPELCESRPYNNKSDVWALGVMLYEMASLELPFESPNMKRLMDDIRRATPIRKRCFTDGMWDLISKMLVKDPYKRLDIDGVLAHPTIVRSIPRIAQLLAAGAGGSAGVGGSGSGSGSNGSGSSDDEKLLAAWKAKRDGNNNNNNIAAPAAIPSAPNPNALPGIFRNNNNNSPPYVGANNQPAPPPRAGANILPTPPAAPPPAGGAPTRDNTPRLPLINNNNNYNYNAPPPPVAAAVAIGGGGGGAAAGAGAGMYRQSPSPIAVAAAAANALNGNYNNNNNYNAPAAGRASPSPPLNNNNNNVVIGAAALERMKRDEEYKKLREEMAKIEENRRLRMEKERKEEALMEDYIKKRDEQIQRKKAAEAAEEELRRAEAVRLLREKEAKEQREAEEARLKDLTLAEAKALAAREAAAKAKAEADRHAALVMAAERERREQQQQPEVMLAEPPMMAGGLRGEEDEEDGLVAVIRNMQTIHNRSVHCIPSEETSEEGGSSNNNGVVPLNSNNNNGNGGAVAMGPSSSSSSSSRPAHLSAALAAADAAANNHTFEDPMGTRINVEEIQLSTPAKVRGGGGGAGLVGLAAAHHHHHAAGATRSADVSALVLSNSDPSPATTTATTTATSSASAVVGLGADNNNNDDDDDDDEPISGGCLCGKVVFAGYLSYVYGSFTCTCGLCCRFSGSAAGVSWLHLPAVLFPEVVTPSDSLRNFSVDTPLGGGVGAQTPHQQQQLKPSYCYFCRRCGSSLAMEHPGVDGCVIAKASLDQKSADLLTRNQRTAKK